MKIKQRLLALLFLSTLLLNGCSGISIPTNVNTAFENFTFSLFQQEAASTTLGLHYTLQHPENYGITDTQNSLGYFETDSTASLAALENCQALLEKFPYNSLSEQNQLTYDVLSSYLKICMNGAAYTLYEEPLSPLTGIHAQLPVLLAEYAFYSVEDAETYLSMLQEIPAYFSSLILFEQAKSDAGLFMSEHAAEAVLEQCRAFISMGENNYMLSSFEERLSQVENLSESERNNFLSQNKKIIVETMIPSYELLIDALEKLKGTGKNEFGLCYLYGGRDYYSYLAERETGSSRSIDELQALMEAQIADDLLAMQELLSEDQNLLQKAAALEENTPETILDYLQNMSKQSFPEAPAVTVEVKYVPEALEPYLSPAFYLTPAIDNITENVIYINQSHDMDNIHLFTTLAHEGYPGHLYQTTYYASTNPNPIRTLFSFKGYVEGWATYTEMCSYYLSSLEKPAAALLQRNNSLILGLYAMADIGIHYHGWNLDRMVEYFKSYGIQDETTLQEIYELIIGDPANYLAYYIGYLEILELKKETISEMKDGFLQKNFHQRILEIGPAPFDVIRKYM